MGERKAVSKEIRQRYSKAARTTKTKILDEFISTVKLNRKYAIQLLKGTLPIREGRLASGKARGRPGVYGQQVLGILKRLWAVFAFMCGKRLAPALRANLALLEKFAEVPGLNPQTRGLLLRISPATIDRLLAPERKKLRLKGRSHTRPGSLRRDQIPIRTFGDAQQKQPGYVEVDLVGHDGGSSRGDYAQTLTLTDVHTGWTEVAAVQNKAQKWVFPAIQHLVSLLPFPVKGLNADNGGEFINVTLMHWCANNHVAFTRSRPYRKNDNPYVEQKNNMVVRDAVGYLRYEGAAEVVLLNKLYAHLRLQINFLFPSMKLVDSKRIGARVCKRYDVAKTPYQRVLDCPHIDAKTKSRLRRQLKEYNPIAIARAIAGIQVQLENKATARQRQIERQRRAELASAV